jgi:hypothetical protein
VSKNSRRQSLVSEALVDAIIGEPKLDLSFARQRALLQFINYIRFPRNAAAVRDSSALCIAKYVCEFFLLNDYARSLTRNEQCELLMEFANPVNLIDMCLSERVFGFHFNDFGDESFTRTVADIVRFLISYNPASDRFKDQASIKKAHFFFCSTPGFGKDHNFSWKRFSTIWGEFKGVSAFIYVNEYHFKRQLIFDPASSDFFERIEKSHESR